MQYEVAEYGLSESELAEGAYVEVVVPMDFNDICTYTEEAIWNRLESIALSGTSYRFDTADYRIVGADDSNNAHVLIGGTVTRY